MTQSTVHIVVKAVAHGWVVTMAGKRRGALTIANGICTATNKKQAIFNKQFGQAWEALV
tara:strand:- start:186 stop:362 length:177 start_codon:yes stop_codon:yes gene_type:complete